MKLTYRPQLDGLRCLAIALVLWQHFSPPELRGDLLLGRYGVRLFFVLSGFLITAILLESRGRTISSALKVFYIRRMLRIFPLFYAVILLALLLDLGNTRPEAWWHLSYLSNVWFAFYSKMAIPTGHLWSLAVEEQFYLVWPFAILLAPRKHLRTIIIATICIGPLFRLVGWTMYWDPRVIRLLTPACMDTLGAGALLAYCEWTRPDLSKRLAAGAGLAGLPIFLLAYTGYSDIVMTLLGDTGAAGVSVWLVYHASKGLGGPGGWILAARPIVYLGKISYGIYLIHFFIPALWLQFTPYEHLHHTAMGFALFTALTIIAAALSHRYLETPINRQKQRWT